MSWTIELTTEAQRHREEEEEKGRERRRRLLQANSTVQWRSPFLPLFSSLCLCASVVQSGGFGRMRLNLPSKRSPLMNRWIRLSWCVCMLALVGFVALPGCQHPAGKTTSPKTGDHAHPKEGPHGGSFAELGTDDEYHAEFIVDSAKKQVTIYILDGEVKTKPTVDPAKITDGKITIKEANSTSIDLKYDPKDAGAKGFA